MKAEGRERKERGGGRDRAREEVTYRQPGCEECMWGCSPGQPLGRGWRVQESREEETRT